jgi:UDP-N-acetyl-D-glucosamine dehydrogenase
MTLCTDLVNKIKKESLVVGIVGLGYVGLPLASAFADRFKVIGLDTDEERVDMLLKGISYIDDVKEIKLDKFTPTTDPNKLKKCDAIIVAVPTPLHEDKRPNLKPVKGASATVGKILKKGQLVVLESTTFPGTTEEIMVPILEKHSGLKALVDFGVAYSPERIDPGNKKYNVTTTPKVVGGLTPEWTDVTAMLYGTVIKDIFKVTDCKTAEMVKIYENIFRNVNIALVNEMALICERLDIDMWEVINAAKTKPYGFMAFYPGPGVGGHCIPLDPYYLAYRARQFGYIPQFIETSGEVNDYMPFHVVNLATNGLLKVGKSIHGAKIVVLGIAYKENVTDTRESPATHIIEELVDRGAVVKVYDPLSKSIRACDRSFNSEKVIAEAIDWADCAILLTAHTKLREELEKELDRARDDFVFVDTRNAIKEPPASYKGIVVRLGAYNSNGEKRANGQFLHLNNSAFIG